MTAQEERDGSQGGEKEGNGGWCVMGGGEMERLIGEGRRVGGETPFSFRRLLFSCLLNDGLLFMFYFSLFWM